MDPCCALLKDLIAIESVNPSLVPGAAGESQIANALADHMRGLGLDVEMQPVVPGRSNVIGVLDGAERGRSLGIILIGAQQGKPKAGSVDRFKINSVSSIVVVPEPSVAMLGILGALALLNRRHRPA